MNIETLVKELGFETLSLPSPDAEIVGGYAGDLLSWVMGRAEEGNVWVTIMTNINIVAVASLVGVSAIVVAENSEISPDVVTKAKEQGINLLRTDMPIFEAVLAIGEKIKA